MILRTISLFLGDSAYNEFSLTSLKLKKDVRTLRTRGKTYIVKKLN